MQAYSFASSEKAKEFRKIGLMKYQAGDIIGANEYQILTSTLMSNFKNMANMKEAINAEIKYQQENQGKFLDADRERYEITKSLLTGNYSISIGNDAKPRYIVGIDKDEDGEISVKEKNMFDKYVRDGYKNSEEMEYVMLDMNKFITGGYRQMMKIDFNKKGGLLDRIEQSIGTTDITKIKGEYIINTKKKFELKDGVIDKDSDKYKQLKATVTAELEDKVTFANAMKYMGNLKKDGSLKGNYEDEDRKKAIEFMINAVVNRVGTTTEEKVRNLTSEERIKMIYAKIFSNEKIAGIRDSNGNPIQSDNDKRKLLNIYAFKAAHALSKFKGKDRDDKATEFLNKLFVSANSGWEFQFTGTNNIEIKDGEGISHTVAVTEVHDVAKIIASQFGVKYNRAGVSLENINNELEKMNLKHKGKDLTSDNIVPVLEEYFERKLSDENPKDPKDPIGINPKDPKNPKD